MLGYTVSRTIPSRCLEGLKVGKLTEYGGVIRHATGTPEAGKVFAHLQFGNLEAIHQVSGHIAPLTNLLNATMALGALNLAVSVAGFSLVYSKLNKIYIKLDSISQELVALLEEQKRNEFLREIERRAKWEANMESLALAIKTKNDALWGTAMGMLNESEKFFKSLAYHILVNDIERACEDSENVYVLLEMAQVATFARAHALALNGNLQEGINTLGDLGAWQNECGEVLEAPGQKMPLWLAKLSTAQRASCRKLVVRQRHIPEAIEYTRNSYHFRINNNISANELAKITEKEPIAFIKTK